MQEHRSGRVVVGYSQDCIVEDDDGALFRCQHRRSTGKPYCGDQVRWQATEPGAGIIEAIEPRRSLLARPNYRNELKPFAANVDRLVIVLAVEPGFDRALVDRYLVLAENLGLKALLWLNKIELAAAEQRQALLATLAPYPALGYPLLAGSTRRGENLDALQACLADQTAVLVGQSGVGKSSLIKALVPDLEVRIGALSHASGLGRHTTTETTLYHLPGGGDLIDSPGIRTLRLGHLSPEQIERGFVEIHRRAGDCRFRNCRHRGEPGCGLEAAVLAGEIDAERFRSYQAILDGESEGRP